MNHLYISDLDGTLLRSDVKISPWAKTQLHQLLSDRINFTIATARSIGSVREILKGIPFNLPIVGGNGAYISDFHSGDHIRIYHIHRDITGPLYHRLANTGHYPFISTFDGNKDTLHYHSPTNDGSTWFVNDRLRAGDKRLTLISNLTSHLKEMIICFTVVDREEKLKDLRNVLQESFPHQLEMHIYDNYYTPGWYWMSIHDSLATKANGILVIAKELGLAPSDLTVFGDNTNDVSMFQIAGRSIAVANAKPEVKQHATHTIGHHETDSVIKFILEDINSVQWTMG